MRMSVSEEELTILAKDFTSVLKLVDELNEVDVSEAEPIYLVKNVTRDDTATEIPRAVRDDIIQGFPAKEGDLLKVPSIL